MGLKRRYLPLASFVFQSGNHSIKERNQWKSSVEMTEVFINISCSAFHRGDKVDVRKPDDSPFGYTWLQATVLGNHEERNLLAVRYDVSRGD